jgi:uncharacterized protein YgiM (DUF1202 family)
MKRNLFFLLLGLLTQSTWAASGSMIKDEDLKSSPSAAASRVSSVSKGSSVEVLARQGGWTQIRAGRNTGWVRILSVRTSVTTSGAGELAALASRRDDRQVVAVAGLRGLNEEELKAARFNAQELMLMDRYRVDQVEATRFARDAHLVPRQVAYLPEPKTTATTTTTTNGNSGWGFGQ